MLRDLPQADANSLQSLCDAGLVEGPTLDFKRLPPGTADDDKREFLKDVCAFANADGGDLVYGLDEKAPAAQGIVPIVGVDSDAMQRRLAQMLEDGIEPRLVGVRFQPIPVPGGFVMVLRVPASFDGPHRTVFKGQSKFFMRSGTHTTELTYMQLRAAFDRTATLHEKAQSFRSDRLSAIRERTTWRPLIGGPVCVLHLLPIASMSGRSSLDISALSQLEHAQFTSRLWAGSGAARSMNLDGLVFYPPHFDKTSNAVFAYTQIFRIGAFEAVMHGGSHMQEGKAIPSTTVTWFYREALDRLLSAARRCGLAGPAIVGAALLGVSGYEFAVGGNFFKPGGPLRADRPDLVLPDVWIESLEQASSPDDVLRPVMDTLWQAFDVARCLEYTEAGEWKPRS